MMKILIIMIIIVIGLRLPAVVLAPGLQGGARGGGAEGLRPAPEQGLILCYSLSYHITSLCYTTVYLL